MHISINTRTQELQHFLPDKTYRYSISSAKNGLGQQAGSEKTPLGRHVIRAKIGAELPSHAVLVGRRFSGEIYDAPLAEKYPNRDWILSRILWLSGLESGKNRLGAVDSMRRYIYIHGTPDSEPMGVPLSHGCIRMTNSDVIELFDRVEVGCTVDITGC
ncbi:MAG: L,D-transpeptidase [Gammaproteobacteria bacterium]|nr:MAG: L,D-transpeptidase [Gammaproteobacteria bacterium]